MHILRGSLLVEDVVSGRLALRLLLFLFFLAEVVAKVIVYKQPIIFILFLIWWWQSNQVVFIGLILQRYVVFCRLHPEDVLLSNFLGGPLIPRIVLIVVLVFFLRCLLVHSRLLQPCRLRRFRLNSGSCFIILYEFLLLFPIFFIAWVQT